MRFTGYLVVLAVFGVVDYTDIVKGFARTLGSNVQLGRAVSPTKLKPKQ